MVKKHLLLIALSFTLVFATLLSSTAQGWTGTDHLEHEGVKIWVNQGGSFGLLYDIQLMLDSGDSISKVFVGQPKRGFTIGAAIDEYDNTVAVSDASSGSDYKVQVTLSWALAVRESVKFNLITNVAGMLYNDTTNPGNIGMQFIPSWYEAPVNDLRIQIVLPPNVTASEVKTTQTYWNNTANEDGSLTVYWEKQNLTPNEQYPIGIKRGLTAVEASYLLEIKPTQVVTEILYSLLQKRVVWTEATNPALKLRVMPDFKDKTGTAENPLRYYEIDFFHAVKSDGTLDEEKLAHTRMNLRDTVEQKLRGYSRKDTVDYYKKIVAKAWTQVEQAGTADIASNAYDEQLLWLLLTPSYRARTETAF